MDPLTPTTSTLAPAISHIADTAEKLASASNSMASNGPNFTIGSAGVNTTSSKESKNKVATVRWACSAPERYRGLIAKGDREIAERDWKQVKGLLDTWQERRVSGARELIKTCEEALEE